MPPRAWRRGTVVGFPERGQISVASPWIWAGDISIEWKVMEEDGTILATRTIATHPASANAMPYDPFVYKVYIAPFTGKLTVEKQ